MKWYYFYGHKGKHQYNQPMWLLPTRKLIFWIGRFQYHLQEIAIQSDGTIAWNNEQMFPCTQQPRSFARMKIYRKMKRWLRLFERELARRQNSEYRVWINKLIHETDPVFNALLFADYCQENEMEVQARKLRKWAATLQGNEKLIKKVLKDLLT